jgi:signal peptidase I
MKNIILFFWETIKVVAVALLIVIPIRYFLFQPFVVSGQSMEPNYSNGDYLIVEALSYRIREPQRGEVIVFYYPENPSFRHIKRIIGLPKERIVIEKDKIRIIKEDGDSFFLNESKYLDYFQSIEKNEIELGEEEYFVMGDNRDASFDSRRWGALPKNYIIGKTVIKIFPLSHFEIINAPSY